MSKFKSNDLVLVLWFDINQNPTWLPRTEALLKKSPVCASVGFFIEEDKSSLKLSSSICLCDDECDSLIIPKGCIKKVYNIQKNKIRELWKKLLSK